MGTISADLGPAGMSWSWAAAQASRHAAARNTAGTDVDGDMVRIGGVTGREGGREGA